MLAALTPPGRLGRMVASAALSISLLASAACGDDGPTGGGSVAGTYALRSLNLGAGVQTVPFNLFDISQFPDPCDDTGNPTFGRLVMRIASGSLVLASNNTFTGSFNVPITFNGTDVSDCFADPEPIDALGGTYTVSGSSITLDPTAAGEANVTGTINGSTITISMQEDVDDDGDLDTIVMVFSK